MSGRGSKRGIILIYRPPDGGFYSVAELTSNPVPPIGPLMSPGLTTTEDRATVPPVRFVTYIRQSATYVIGPAAGRALGLILVPFVVAGLGADDFGRFEILSTAGTALATIFLLGMDLSTLSLYHRPEAATRGAVFPSAAGVSISLAILIVGAVWLFRANLASIWLNEPTATLSVFLVGVYSAATLIALVGRAALRVDNLASRHSAATAATSVGTAILTLTVIWVGATLDRIMLAQVGGAIVGAVAAVWLARRRFAGRFDRRVARSLITLGVPQMVAMVALWGGELGHRLLVFGAAGAAEVGSLGVGARVAAVLSFVVIGLQSAWHPRVFEQLSGADGEVRIGRDARRVASLLCIAATGLSLIARQGVDLLGGGRFSNAGLVAGWLMVMVAGTGFVQLSSLYSVVHRRFEDLAVSMVLGTIVGLGVSAVLVRHHGAVGAAAGMAAGQWIAAAAGFVMAKRRGLLLLPAKLIVLPALVAMPLCVLISSGLPILPRFGAAGLSVAVSGALLVSATRESATAQRR